MTIFLPRISLFTPLLLPFSAGTISIFNWVAWMQRSGIRVLSWNLFRKPPKALTDASVIADG